MSSAYFHDISSSADWTLVKQVKKGWSRDKKFYIEDKNGRQLLLRLADAELYDKKEQEFNVMAKVAKRLDLKMSQPIEFGICGEGKYVYSLLTWIEGTAADEAVAALSKAEQYQMGLSAGRILKQFHSIPAPAEQQDWEERMTVKIGRHLERYKACEIKVANDDVALQYVSENLHLLKDRPQVFQHGDFHVGNLIITPKKELGVIDFNRWDYGDPFEDFYKMMLFSREISISFAHGQLKGYFGNKVPNNFFDILALYLADVILYGIVWAIPFGEDDVKNMISRTEMILEDYDYFKTTIPKWLSK